MVKKRIGSSPVEDGIAQGEFELPEYLGKGVYQLIAEYKGSNIYKPSYDIKQLIIGWLAELELSDYTIGEDRQLDAQTTLYGTDDSNQKSLLPYRNIIFKIGKWDPTNTDSVLVKCNNAVAIIPDGQTSEIVKTNEYGVAYWSGTISTDFVNEHYYLYAYYEGDNDYISAIAQSNLIIGPRSTRIELTVWPGTHIYNDYGTCVVTGRVYLEDDYITGTRDKNASPITEGKLVLKHGNTADASKHITVDDDELYVNMLSDTLAEDGQVRFMYTFVGGVNKTRYISAKYSGVSGKYKYSETSASTQIKIQIDGDGINANILSRIDGKDPSPTVLYVEEGTKSCHTIEYTTDGKTSAGSGKLETVVFTED